MNPIARQKLIELVERFGGGVCDDPRRCEALLRDLCGDQHQREVFVLVAAVRNREAAELAAVGGGVPKEVLLARLSARLHRNCGFTEDLARWSVESWALALDKITTINKTIETLLQLAHEHGHLTCDDVNNNLPDGLTPEDRDHLYEKLRSLNIKIVDFAQEAAEQGHTHAQHNLAARYARESHLAASIAEKSLAASYANGEGVEADKEEAVRWYRKAAEQGRVHAQCHLAASYANGEGVGKNKEEAVKWYRKAAKQGHAVFCPWCSQVESLEAGGDR